MPMSARIILTALTLMCASWVLAASCEDTKWNDAAVTTAVFATCATVITLILGFLHIIWTTP